MQPYPTDRLQGGTEQPIYDAVFEAVLDQRLAPGTRLTEASLVELFGVSRTIVRMALLRLAHDHIVMLKPNHGASIASPTPDETRAVFEARRMIECAALPAAIARAHAAPARQPARAGASRKTARSMPARCAAGSGCRASSIAGWSRWRAIR